MNPRRWLIGTAIVTIALWVAVLVWPQTAQPQGVDARTLDPFTTDSFCDWQAGDPEAGRALFEQPVIGGAAGCATCHSVTEGEVLIGPSLYDIPTTATTRQPGVLPHNYLYLAVIHPDQFLVEGYSAGLMPQTYGDYLTQVDMTNLVSFLMSLNASQ